MCGSLPRQAPPPVPLTKPYREQSLSAGLGAGPQVPAALGAAYSHSSNPNPSFNPGPGPGLAPSLSQASLVHGSPRPSRTLDRDRERDGTASVRRGSFVERCQERAKGSEAAGGAGPEGMRRSLAVCSELEARLGLRTPTTFTVSPGGRLAGGAPVSPSMASSSSVSNRRATPTSPISPASTVSSPTRSQAPVSPRRGAGSSPADVPPSPDSPANPDSPAAGPPTSPKPPMNETSF